MKRKYIVLNKEGHQIAVDTVFIDEYMSYLKSHDRIQKDIAKKRSYIEEGHWRKEYFEKESPNSRVADIYIWKSKLRSVVAGSMID